MTGKTYGHRVDRPRQRRRRKLIHLVVVSREAIESLPAIRPGHDVISITDPGKPVAAIAKGTRKVLRLAFDDLDREPSLATQRAGYFRLFTQTDAAQIKQFVHERFNGAGTRKFIIHCEAGISRSAGTAQALDVSINGGEKEWWDRQPFYRPNPLVYRVLLEELRR